MRRTHTGRGSARTVGLVVAVVGGLLGTLLTSSPAAATAYRTLASVNDAIGDPEVVSGNPGQRQINGTDLEGAGLSGRRSDDSDSLSVSWVMAAWPGRIDGTRLDIDYTYLDRHGHPVTAVQTFDTRADHQASFSSPNVDDPRCASHIGMVVDTPKANGRMHMDWACIEQAETFSVQLRFTTYAGDDEVTDEIDFGTVSMTAFRFLRVHDRAGDTEGSSPRARFADLSALRLAYNADLDRVSLRVKFRKIVTWPSKVRQRVWFSWGYLNDEGKRRSRNGFVYLVPGGSAAEASIMGGQCTDARTAIDPSNGLVTVTFPAACLGGASTFSANVRADAMSADGTTSYGFDRGSSLWQGILLR